MTDEREERLVEAMEGIANALHRLSKCVDDPNSAGEYGAIRDINVCLRGFGTGDYPVSVDLGVVKVREED
jgi:hypothetical protein